MEQAPVGMLVFNESFPENKNGRLNITLAVVRLIAFGLIPGGAIIPSKRAWEAVVETWEKGIAARKGMEPQPEQE